MTRKHRSFFNRLKRKVLIYGFLLLALWGVYYELWGKHLYIVTAYCNCPICINIREFRDKHFASGRQIYWGGAAASSKIPFGSKIELVPLLPQDWLAIATFLRGRSEFTAEDRGSKIRGKHIDLFIPDSLGGHRVARRWGIRRMRLKINGELAE